MHAHSAVRWVALSYDNMFMYVYLNTVTKFYCCALTAHHIYCCTVIVIMHGSCGNHVVLIHSYCYELCVC